MGDHSLKGKGEPAVMRPRRSQPWVGSKRIFRSLGANARNDASITKLLSPAKPAKSPSGGAEPQKFPSSTADACRPSDAELRANAVDIDSEEEAIGGGVAMEAVPPSNPSSSRRMSEGGA